MEEAKNVFEGEASESDEEACVNTKVDQFKQIKLTPVRAALPSRASVVVSGEASESSDEELEIDTSESQVTPLQVDQFRRGDSVELSPDRESSRTSSRLSHYSDKDGEPKYDTLLHGKLREKNASLRRNLCDTLGQVYLSSAKEIRSITQSLLRSQSSIQDVSHNMGLLTNDLFHLEDKVDIITSCNLLPEINIPTEQPAAAAAAAAVS